MDVPPPPAREPSHPTDGYAPNAANPPTLERRPARPRRMIAFPPIGAHAARSKRTQVTHLIRRRDTGFSPTCRRWGLPFKPWEYRFKPRRPGSSGLPGCFCHNDPEACRRTSGVTGSRSDWDFARPVSLRGMSLCATLKKTIFLRRLSWPRHRPNKVWAVTVALRYWGGEGQWANSALAKW